MWAAAALAAACVVGQARVSMLGAARPAGPAAGPRPGDVVRLHPTPGTAIPLVKLWRHSEVEGRLVRDDIYAGIFAEAVAAGRREAIHRMADREQVRWAYAGASGFAVTVLAVRDDPVLKAPVAEVVAGERPRRSPGQVHGVFWLPAAYLRAPGGLPVLVHRTRDAATVACPARDCTGMEAVPAAEAERAWKASRRGAAAR